MGVYKTDIVCQRDMKCEVCCPWLSDVNGVHVCRRRPEAIPVFPSVLRAVLPFSGMNPAFGLSRTVKALSRRSQLSC